MRYGSWLSTQSEGGVHSLVPPMLLSNQPMSVAQKVRNCWSDARVGSLIVGIIISIIHGVLMVVVLGSAIYYLLFMPRVITYDLHNVNTVEGLLNIANSSIVSTFFMSMLDFSFAVVLCYGAAQKKATYLKGYFIYGIVKTVKLSILSIILCLITWNIFVCFVTLGFCGLNIAVVYMVNVAYKSVKKSHKIFKCEDDAVETKSAVCDFQYKHFKTSYP